MRDVIDNRLYLAYGSNLNIEQMLERCKTATAVRRFSINGWKLIFRDYADIEPSEGSVVHGALYRVMAADVAALDRYEGVNSGLYRQVTFRIKDTQELGFFYVMNDNSGNYPPTSNYFDTIVDGYGDWQLPLSKLHDAHKESLDWADAVDAQMEADLAQVLSREEIIASQRSHGCFTGMELDGVPCCDDCWCVHEAESAKQVLNRRNIFGPSECDSLTSSYKNTPHQRLNSHKSSMIPR